MLEGAYMKPEMKCLSTMKRIMFTLLFIAGEMQCNFVSGVTEVNQPIKKCKQTRARYRDEYVGGNNAGIY